MRFNDFHVRTVIFNIFLVLCLPKATESYQLEPVELPAGIDNIILFTDEELAKYDGSNPDLPIYIAVKGVVFDVTTGSEHYKKGESYHVLAGKDCSRAVALFSLEPEDAISDVSNLTEKQLKALDQMFKNVYMAKYPIVGYMKYLIDSKLRQSVEL